ncbi:mCpol domain-containing protein [Rhodococcus fascians]|uniref:mCpol domain-containing protein n=1 Tax=Rhodococcoides fascians TaxID=1828 RepID=UPI00050BDD2F|nr:hypothetical protein A3L23_03622 [Rhodococcus fascians D188]MBY4208902.1 mCpol domain-containing protein [Rhodococcus fascians]
MFAIIDGDDIGPTIEALLLSNDLNGFVERSAEVTTSIKLLATKLNEISQASLLSLGGDSMLFEISDVANREFSEFLHYWNANCKVKVSAGLGHDLQSAFLALRMAKSTGKQRVITFGTF